MPDAAELEDGADAEPNADDEEDGPPVLLLDLVRPKTVGAGGPERDAPAGFTPDVLAAFEREPELIDVVALHLLERHFAPGLHEEILEAVGLELGTPVATRRRDMAFRAAVLEAYLAECCVCGFRCVWWTA